MEGDLSHPQQVRECHSCHAPLSEQQPHDTRLQPSPVFDHALQETGVSCAGCHVRAHVRYGPPRRAEAPIGSGPAAHGGFEVRSEFRDSAFCAECHQFFDTLGPAGKPLENTWAEWRSSPQAAAGQTCQSCHMPDRSHSWRGIHDLEMVRDAVDVALVPIDTADGAWVSLILRNRDVGHAFPTYVTPRVFLSIAQLDTSGAELPDTRVDSVIGREVDLGLGRELFDTRVSPGESVRLDYAIRPVPGAVELVARVVVDPDYHYRGVYAFLLDDLQDAEALELIEEASRRIAESSYELTTIRRPIGDSVN